MNGQLLALLCGILGGLAGYALQYYCAVIAYPLDSSFQPCAKRSHWWRARKRQDGLAPGLPLPVWLLQGQRLAIIPAYQPSREDDDLLDHQLTAFQKAEKLFSSKQLGDHRPSKLLSEMMELNFPCWKIVFRTSWMMPTKLSKN